jgi:hypothetical protein
VVECGVDHDVVDVHELAAHVVQGAGVGVVGAAERLPEHKLAQHVHRDAQAHVVQVCHTGVGAAAHSRQSRIGCIGDVGEQCPAWRRGRCGKVCVGVLQARVTVIVTWLAACSN